MFGYIFQWDYTHLFNFRFFFTVADLTLGLVPKNIHYNNYNIFQVDVQRASNFV